LILGKATKAFDDLRVEAGELLDSLEVGVRDRGRLNSQTPSSGVLDATAATALAKLVPGDPQQPRRDRTSLYPVSATGGERCGEHFG
jgi:hypothetical protein